MEALMSKAVVLPIILLLTVAACSGSDDAPTAPIPVANSAPLFSSATTATTAENSSGTVYTAAASDADGDPVTFSISGGADQAAFTLTGAAMSFTTSPDFEVPGDADSNNVYEVILAANDGAQSTLLNLSLTVTDETGGFVVSRVVTGITQPLFVLGRGDGTNRIFITGKPGRIDILDLDTGALSPTPFLDLTGQISAAGEMGLLGMALAPDFAVSGTFYLYVNALNGDSEIRRYQVSTANSDVADPASADTILVQPQPATNHNAGWIGFGPDDFLYVAFGDGGGANDPFDNGQNLNTLHSTIVRIDPTSDDFPADPNRDYAIPADNPFATSGGLPEIYAYGLRNPFRASFDRLTGNLFIGDVGQADMEEVDLIQPGDAGLNFGWPILEGTRVNMPGSSAGFAPPVTEYGHGSGPLEGGSIAGGYVYRGPIEDLQGQYVFGDFVSDNVWTVDAGLLVQGQTQDTSAFTVITADAQPDAGSLSSITSFGEDDAANLYVMTIGGDVFRFDPES